MTLWRRTRNEVAGAWRSLRYDLGRPGAHAPGRRTGQNPGRAAGYPEVTSTGLSTFGGSGILHGLRISSGEEGEQYVPRPRRLVAVSTFGALAVLGAAGSYFAVVNGIGSLVGDEPVGTDPYPLAAEAPRGSESELSNSGLGRGAASLPDQVPVATETAPGLIRILPTGTAAPAIMPDPAQPRPLQTTVERTTPTTRPTTCDCLTPPVPTPTMPAPVPTPTPHSPSAAPSPSASPDYSEPPRPSEPTESAAPATSGN